jgi:hypothetical protein
MKILKTALRILWRRADWTLTSLIIFIAGFSAIIHSLRGGQGIDTGLNLKLGIIAVIAGGLFFWKTIGQELVKEIKKKK